MIDANDKATADLIGDAPKRRGRPSTGKAKSSAERMRELRRRNGWAIGDDFDGLTNTGLYELLASVHAKGQENLFERCVAELRKRMVHNSSQ
ncbi:MAG: hypothetical protein JSR83_22385 [Proteobacteria bacterium]|nr:hypothetical protein [Pseudomonadota bacterium]